MGQTQLATDVRPLGMGLGLSGQVSYGPKLWRPVVAVEHVAQVGEAWSDQKIINGKPFVAFLNMKQKKPRYAFL